MEKMTNVKALEYVLDNFASEENAVLPEDVTEKLIAMKVSFEKKSANRKATKTQEENAGIKIMILESLSAIGSPVTVSDLQNRYAALGQYSNQRISALLRQLVNEEKVVKSTDKKKSYFAVA